MHRISLLVPVCAAALFAATASAAPQYNKTQPRPQRGSQPAKQPDPAPPTDPAQQTAPPMGEDLKEASQANSPGEAKYYDRLDAADRDALQVNVGYIMPAPEGQIDWIGGDPLMAADFRGKVTVLQSVGGKSGGRSTIEKLKKVLPEDVQLIAVHVPENADRAQAIFGQNTPCLVAVDRSGEWCDDLGIWKRPVNIVIDKTGAVRFVGLSELGLKTKLAPLLAEVVDDSVVAKQRPNAPAKPAEAAVKPTAWPTFTNDAGGIDQRGKTLPRFTVQKWITRQPDPAGRLVAIDFWATWCGPCRASIPHLNELQNKYGNDLLIVGVSNESNSNFEQGTRKQKLKESDFAYALALDPSGQMLNFFKPRGIPSMAIISSSDLVVRWQGHPTDLQEADLQKLIEANKALSKMPAKTGDGERGWTKATSSTGR